MDDPVREWTTLPRRIYLDTCTLQAIYDHGAFLWEGEPLGPRAGGNRGADWRADMDALARILAVNERAQFELVVTTASLREVVRRPDSKEYRQWVYDVEETWLVQSQGTHFEETATFHEPRFGMVSRADRLLLQDALDTGCDAFLTLEKNLPTAAPFIERTTGIRVLRPSEYWTLLKPWAALYS